jgi:hypothetical protein
VDTFADLGSKDLYEIIDGVKVEIPPMSAHSSVLASRLAHRINLFTMPKE